MLQSEDVKTTTYKDYVSSSFKWKPCNPPSRDLDLIIHLKSFCFFKMRETVYSLRSQMDIDYIESYVSGSLEEKIIDNIFKEISILRKMYKLKIIKNLHSDLVIRAPKRNDSCSIRDLNVFQEDGFKEFRKKVNLSIFFTDFYKNVLDSGIENNKDFEVISPSDSSLNNSSIEISKHIGNVYSDNLDVLLYGSPVIFKLHNGSWECKTIQDLHLHLGAKDNQDALHRATILGFDYSNGIKNVRLSSLSGDLSKFAKQLIVDRPEVANLFFSQER